MANKSNKRKGKNKGSVAKAKNYYMSVKLKLVLFIVLSILMLATLPFSSFFESIINAEYYQKLESQQANFSAEDSNEFNANDLHISFVAVGSADAIVVKLPDNKIMVIDSGNNTKDSKGVFLRYLQDNIYATKGDKILDYYIITHPDIDHFGGTIDLLKEYTVKNIYRPTMLGIDEAKEYKNNGIVDEEDNFKVKSTGGAIYNNSIKAIKKEKAEEDASVYYNKAGIVIENTSLSNPYKFTFLAPTSTSFEDSNDYSAVILLEYKEKKVLFTGDATGTTESELFAYKNNNSINIACDVLKIAHHGSNTHGSNSAELLSAVNPTYAIISCKAGAYDNLPSTKTLARINECGVAKENILRTDVVGTIVVGFSMANNLLVMAGDEIIVAVNDMVFISWLYVVIVVIIVLGAVLIPGFKLNKKKTSH